MEEKSFPITYLNWKDLVGRFTDEQIEKLTADDMRRIASRMESYYLDGQFYGDLKHAVNEVLSEI